MPVEYNGHEFYPNDTVVADLTAALTLAAHKGGNATQTVMLGDSPVALRRNELAACLETVMLARSGQTKGGGDS